MNKSKDSNIKRATARETENETRRKTQQLLVTLCWFFPLLCYRDESNDAQERREKKRSEKPYVRVCVCPKLVVHFNAVDCLLYTHAKTVQVLFHVDWCVFSSFLCRVLIRFEHLHFRFSCPANLWATELDSLNHVRHFSGYTATTTKTKQKSL